MSDRKAEFRKRAQTYVAKAYYENDPHMKGFYLRLAETWLNLAQQPEQLVETDRK